MEGAPLTALSTKCCFASSNRHNMAESPYSNVRAFSATEFNTARTSSWEAISRLTSLSAFQLAGSLGNTCLKRGGQVEQF